MYTAHFRIKAIVVFVFVVSSFSCAFGQPSPHAKIDLQKAKPMIDSLNQQFSKQYFKGDSIALYNMYAKDASFGSAKGNDILSAWGAMIRNSIKDDSRTIVFKTTALSTDSEFLVDLGTYEMKDSNGNTKSKGKYLVVWKQEDGRWKLYRDVGL
jgi:ketosteroid isomerase-like protein